LQLNRNKKGSLSCPFTFYLYNLTNTILKEKELLSLLNALDLRWRAGDRDLDVLEAVYRKYSYVARWRQQLEEREIALMTE